MLAQLLKSLFRFSIERKRRARIVNAPHLIDIPRAYPGDDLYEGPIRITMRVCVHVACIHLTADDLSSAVLSQFEHRASLQFKNFIHILDSRNLKSLLEKSWRMAETAEDSF